MSRFHVHGTVTDLESGDEVASLTISVDAKDDEDAQHQVFNLLPDIGLDITEIEHDDPTPYCTHCGAATMRQCDCWPLPKTF